MGRPSVDQVGEHQEDDRRDRAPARARDAAATGGVPLHFLMYNVDAPDGVSRAVLTLANHLSLTHPVEVISLYRRHQGPAYAIAEGVQVTYLFDHPPVRRQAADGDRTRAGRAARAWWPPSRHAARNVLAGRPSRLSGGRGFPNFSLLSDVLLWRRCAASAPGC